MNPGNVIIGGKSISLGREIGRGGEGTVYAIGNNPDHAIKVYSKPDRQREAKIEAMVAARLHEKSALIAFPKSVARYSDGTFAGFSMRLVKGHKALHELYAPGARKAAFPKADYRFLIHAARNISIAVSHVHDAGCVIGDINHSGILISDKAIAALIDADSFQFGAGFKCRVGVPEYTPPELQGKNLGEVQRTAIHDAFGLAVVIFQMLFMGRHPYVGRFSGGDLSISEAISRGNFVYARQASSGAKPPPASASLIDFPNDVGSLFEAAFDKDYVRRPTAKAWADGLKALEHSLSKCQKNDLHYFPSASKSCLWCRLENASGVVLFEEPLPTGEVASDPGATSFDLDAAWRAIAAVKIPSANELQVAVSVASLEPSASVKEALGQRRQEILAGIAALVVAAALAGYSFALWLIYVPLAVWGYFRVYSESSAHAPSQEHYEKAYQAFESAKSDWHRRIGLDELVSRRSELENAKATFSSLADRKKQEISALHSKRHDAQLRRYLERFRLRPGKVSGVGRGKIATLASYGIDTAAAIERSRILSIQGFGPTTTKALLDWKQSIVGKFRYDRKMTQQDRDDLLRLENRFAAEARKLRTMLAGGASELRASVKQVHRRAGRPDAALDKAARDLEQAKLDLETLGATIPKVAPATASAGNVSPAPRRSRLRAVPSKGRAPISSGIPNCPNCGNRMVRRKARRGSNRGNYFWGCSAYPACRGTRRI